MWSTGCQPVWLVVPFASEASPPRSATDRLVLLLSSVGPAGPGAAADAGSSTAATAGLLSTARAGAAERQEASAVGVMQSTRKSTMPAGVRLSAPAATPLQQASRRVPAAEARRMQAAHSCWPAPSVPGTFSAFSPCGTGSPMHFGSGGDDSIRAMVRAPDEVEVNDEVRGGIVTGVTRDGRQCQIAVWPPPPGNEEGKRRQAMALCITAEEKSEAAARAATGGDSTFPPVNVPTLQATASEAEVSSAADACAEAPAPIGAAMVPETSAPAGDEVRLRAAHGLLELAPALSEVENCSSPQGAAMALPKVAGTDPPGSKPQGTQSNLRLTPEEELQPRSGCAAVSPVSRALPTPNDGGNELKNTTRTSESRLSELQTPKRLKLQDDDDMDVELRGNSAESAGSENTVGLTGLSRRRDLATAVNAMEVDDGNRGGVTRNGRQRRPPAFFSQEPAEGGAKVRNDEARSACKARAANGGSKNSKVSPISELSEEQEKAMHDLKQCENKNCRQWRHFPGECGGPFQCEMISELARSERGACAQGPRPGLDDAWVRTRCFENVQNVVFDEDEFLREPICENAYQLMIDKLEHKGFLPKQCIDDLSNMKGAMVARYRKLVDEVEPDCRQRHALGRVAGLRNICSYILKNLVPKARCEDYDDNFQYENGRWRIADLETFLDEVSAS